MAHDSILSTGEALSGESWEVQGQPAPHCETWSQNKSTTYNNTMLRNTIKICMLKTSQLLKEVKDLNEQNVMLQPWTGRWGVIKTSILSDRCSQGCSNQGPDVLLVGIGTPILKLTCEGNSTGTAPGGAYRRRRNKEDPSRDSPAFHKAVW